MPVKSKLEKVLEQLEIADPEQGVYYSGQRVRSPEEAMARADILRKAEIEATVAQIRKYGTPAENDQLDKLLGKETGREQESKLTTIGKTLKVDVDPVLARKKALINSILGL